MKRTELLFIRTILSLFIVGVLGVLSLNAQTVNNGDFESWTTGEPDDWTLVENFSGGTSFNQLVSGGLSGDALEIVANASNFGADGQITNIVLDITENNFYKLSVMLKSNDDLTKFKFADLKWLDASDVQIGSAFSGTALNDDTGDVWTLYELDLNPIQAPAGAAKLEVSFNYYFNSGIVSGVSNLIVDDFIVSDVTTEMNAVQHAIDNSTLTNSTNLIDITYADDAVFSSTISYATFQPALPIDLLADVLFETDLALDAGANINIQHAGYGINENYIAVGGETSLWLSEMVSSPRTPLAGYTGVSDVWNITITGLLGGTYNVTLSSIADDDYADAYNRYILGSDIVQINVESEEEIAIQHGIDNTTLTVDPASQVIMTSGTADVASVLTFPAFQTAFPTDLMWDVLIEFSGDPLPAGAQMDIVVNSMPFASYTAVGGETQLWFFDLDVPDLLARDYLTNSSGDVNNVDFQFSNITVEGTYTVDFSVVVDLETGFTAPLDWTAYAQEQTEIIVSNTPIVLFPVFEDFEDAMFYFDNGVSDVNWVPNATLYFEGARSYHNAYGSNNTNNLELVGAVDISSATNPTLAFHHIAKSENNWDHCYVEVSTDGITWTILPATAYMGTGNYVAPTQNSPEGPCFMPSSYSEWDVIGNPDNTWWKRDKFSLADYAGATELYVRFRLKSDGTGQYAGWYIDAISIYDELCPEPINLLVDNITVEGGELSWTGAGSLWNAEVGLVGFAPGMGEEEAVFTGITTNPFTMTGLSDNVEYQVYIQTDCDVDGVSVWSGPFNFTTLPLCPWPVDLAVDESLSDGAIFSWTAGDAESEWNIEVGAAGFNPGAGEELFAYATVVDNPYTATGMDPETSYHVFVQADCDVNGTSVWEGPVSFTTLPLCPDPENLQLDIAGGDFATVSWNQPGAAGTWDLIWDVAGFNPSVEGNLEADIVTNPFDIIGLTANTDYHFYVRADCAADGTSAWVGPAAFTTECDVVSVPYIEDFENSGETPDCWTNFGTEEWQFATSGSGNHCAPADHTSGTGYFAYVDDSESPFATDVTLETPYIDISTLTNPALYFWVYSDNEGSGDNMTLRINVWNGTDWDLDVSTWSAQTTGWQQVIVPLNLYLGSTALKIQFVGDETSSGSNFYDDISIDDIEVKEGPTCPMPVSLTLSNVLPTSADIVWTESGTALEWNLIWGLEGFDPATEGTLESGLLVESFSLTGLTPNTAYQVYVQAVCTDLSDWSAPVTINTPCDIEALPYLEDFEGGTFAPDCWINASGTLAEPTVLGSTVYWVQDGFGNVGSTGSAKMNIYYEREGWLITPIFDLGDGSTSYMLEFDLALTDYSYASSPDMNGTDDRFAVVISTDNGLTWNESDALRLWDNQGSAYVYNDIPYTGEHVLLDLSAYTGTVKIGFYGESTASNADNDLFVDNVAINELPACFAPLTISTSNYTENAVDVEWTEFVTGTDWELIYGIPGFDPLTEGTIASGITTNPYTLTGLATGTTYDIYVRTDCGGDVSDWVGPDNFTTVATCFAPLSLDGINITDISVDLTWTESGTAGEWEIIYGAVGFNPFVEGTLITGITAQPYILTGLDHTTDYDIYVRANCGTETSPWSDVFTMTTECGANIPMWTEDFEGTFTPQCWSRLSGLLADPSTVVTATSGWVADGYANVGTTGSAKTNIYGTNWNYWLVTPIIDLGDGTTLHYNLEFDLALTDFGSTGAPDQNGLDDRFAVVISTDNGVTWSETNVLRMWDNQGSAFVYNDIPHTGEHIIIDLTAYTGEVKFAFYGESSTTDADNDLFVDNVLVWEIPSCPQPTTFSASYVGGDNVEVTWTDISGASEWEVFYGAPDFDPATEGASAIATASPYVITGLTPETDYEIYVRANCAVGDESFLTGPIVVTTDVLCPGTASTAVYSTGQYQTTVTWSTTGGTSWEIIYGLAGFNPETEGTLVDDILAQPYNLTGLDAGTDYDVYVRVDCDANGVSEWDGPASFTTLPSCAIPSALTTADLTSTSVTLSWTENGTATDWTIIYGVQGFDPLTEGTTETVTGTPTLALTGLVAATTYDVYLIANCGVGDDSEMGGPFNFSTECGVIDVFPYSESFDGTTYAPVCWVNAQVTGPGTGTWDRQTTGSSPTCAPHSGAAMSRFNAYSYSSGTRGMLVTPPLSFADDNFEVIFWMYRDNGYLSNAEQVNVYYNTTQDLTDAVLLGTVNRSINLDPVVGANGWYEYTFPVPAGVSGDSYIVFEGVSAYGNNIFIDDVTVQVPPTCPQPTTITLEANAGYETTIGWTEVGTAAEWEVIYGAPGFDPLTEGTTITGVTDNPYIITGLTPETDYEVYVRAYCAVDDQSFWTGPMAWTTDVACPDIINATLDAADFESLTILIEASGTETTWNVTYGLEGFVVGEGTTIVVTENPFTITGLAAETSYDVIIQADCGAVDGTSGFVGPYTYSTTEACPEVTDITLDFVNYESAEISWTAGSTETIWDVIYGASGFDPLTGGTTVTDVTTPYTISGLTEETGYDVYVIADCGAVLGESTMAGPFAFTTTELCPVVSGIALTSVSDITASIEWTAGSTETLWALEWGEAGFVQGSGTMEVVTTDAMFDFIGLLANTDYDVYIQADCEGVLGTAEWVLFEFSTACATISDFTWIEEFEDWAAVTDCWDLTGGTNEVSQYASNSVEGSYWGWTGGSTAYLTSPNFDISSLTVPVIEFMWSHQYNTSYPEDALELQVTDDDGATWTPVWTKVGEDLNSDDGATSTAPGTYVTSGQLDLSAFGDNIKFRFYFYSGYGPDLFIDNVSIYEMTCDVPADLAVDSFDETTATISYTDVAATGSINVIYGENGFDPLTEGTTIPAITENPYTITGLTHNTAYQVYITTDCGIMSSALVGPVDFTTLAYSMETDILTFTFGALDFQAADIDNVAKTVDVIVVNGTDLTNLVAEFTLSDGATANIGGIDQESTVTSNNFNTPVIYNVVAEDMTSNTDWTVNVSIASQISLVGDGSIAVYPNPNHGKFDISFTNITDAVTYQLFDTKSSIILENKVKSTDKYVEKIDLDLQPGVYYLRIISNEQTHIEKIVIK